MRPPSSAQPNVQNNQNRFGQSQGFNRCNNFNQEQPYQATAQSNQNFHLNELEKIKRMNDVSMKAMQNQIDMMNTTSTSGLGYLPGNTVAKPKGELKAITTHSGLATDGPTVPTPPKSVTPEEDECVEETYTDPDLTEYTIKVPPPPKKLGLPDLIPTRITLELANRAICTPDGITRDVFVLVGKFTFPADFVVVDYESDPRVPLFSGRPFLRTARALIDVHGEEMILRDEDERLTLNMKHDTTSYSNHPHRESANLINIFNIPSKDCLEVSVSNKQSGNPTFSLYKEITSSKVTHEFYDSDGCARRWNRSSYWEWWNRSSGLVSLATGPDLEQSDWTQSSNIKELPDIDSFNDIHSHFDDDPLSGSTTYSANSLLEEFADELALISYPLDYDDYRACDIESDIKEIEFLVFQ
nr:reverse transcriptase domain-containing protein [Tanacetum cinerariifolium]